MQNLEENPEKNYSDEKKKEMIIENSPNYFLFQNLIYGKEFI